MLLRKGADITAKKVDGKTPVNLAADNSIKQLLSNNRDEKKDYYITRYQAKDGSQITRDDTYGLPYILINDFVTTAHFDPEKTKRMLKQIPDLLYARASWDEIAVEGCTHLGNEQLAQFLLDAGSPLSVCTATMFGLTNEVKDMIDKNPYTINDRGPHDFPLIWYTAIGKQKLDIAEYLIGKGIDVNANIRGRSALSECARRGHAELTELLIQKGADLNMVSVSSFFPGTPIQIAKSRKQDKVVAVLRKYKANE
jgi:ankyrin repeat protein